MRSSDRTPRSLSVSPQDGHSTDLIATERTARLSLRQNAPMDRIREEIQASGAIGFDRFMEIALYDPDVGYFSAGELRSERSGDFLTSPEISPMFGETIGRFTRAEHDRIGGPFSVVEVGAGTGSLLRPLVDSLGFPLTGVWAVERSSAARASIERTVPEAQLSEMIPESIRGVVVANELLDNLPAAIAQRTGDGWVERVVVAAGDGLEWGVRPAGDDLVEWADAHAGQVPQGGLVEVQIQATAWVEECVAALTSGALLLFDYGDLAENLQHRRAEGTVRTYQDHHLGPDPLAEPGSTDITFDVDFSALLTVARQAGADAEVIRQDEFLARWGLRDRLDELRGRELEAARGDRVMERLLLRSRITEGETLLHPRGLGDFRVLVARL